VTTAGRLFHALWPLAVLLLLLVTFRRTAPESPSNVHSIDCARTSSGDLARLEACAALDPTDVELVTDVGRAYENAGDTAKAEDTYRRALLLDPDDGDVHLRLGELLAGRGDRTGARHEAMAALISQPRNDRAERLLEHVGDGRVDEAKR
jgi:Flp pilus assembly protein TadD